MERVRVILAAHGEAESAGFIENFKVSRHTLAHAAEVMHLPAPLRWVICSLGGLRKRLKGGPGSPHNENTRRQASALQAVLEQAGDVDYRVEAAFASSPPYVEQQLALPGGVDHQVVVSMIPTDSRLSCGLVCHALCEEADAPRQRTSIVARMWDDDALTAIHRDHVLARFPAPAPAAPCCLVLVLHGTVVRDRHGGPPGFHAGIEEKDVYGEALRAALMDLPDRPWQRVELAYLNHGVGGQWSSPTLDDLMKTLAGEGVKSVVAYPCEHLVDGGETTGLPAVLAATDVPETHCLPCLNDHSGFIDYLAARVRSVEHARRENRCTPCPLNA
ncbi:ferrochelatase [Wenzhouxiangella sp. XN79A]|uniref:ferrochelatase n=1 Tax=Wenzhouxiangella sp. XN79A TaxID=2724193 RepID=UPI00144A96FC|nr:ferrochelatase [Wenzhouxiangella sp. XN79A]NKI36570.1 ferrochelatase [Wenzhouxiangella sp. XN79A]